jgi:hypothetical protein
MEQRKKMKIMGDNTENLGNLDSEEQRKLYKDKTQKGVNEGTMKEGEERNRGRNKGTKRQKEKGR